MNTSSADMKHIYFFSEVAQFRNEIFRDAVIWKNILSGVYVGELGFKFSLRSRYGGEDVDEGHVRPSTTRKLFAVLAEKNTRGQPGLLSYPLKQQQNYKDYAFIFTKVTSKSQRFPFPSWGKL